MRYFATKARGLQKAKLNLSFHVFLMKGDRGFNGSRGPPGSLGEFGRMGLEGERGEPGQEGERVRKSFLQ